MKIILLAQAEGHTEPESAEEYKALRIAALDDHLIKSNLPTFVRTCASLKEFLIYIKGEGRQSYANRREFIHEAFEPLILYVQDLPDGDRSAGPTHRMLQHPMPSEAAATTRPAPPQRQPINRPPNSGGIVQKIEPVLLDNNHKTVFIGHGRSPIWLQLDKFLRDRLHLATDEFNAESTAGVPTVRRLEEMLARASFAFLVMTAEDVHADSTAHARENVIHEVGLFQGKLGFERAIVLLENGCQRFSNIDGLTHIPFPKGDIEPAFEKIRQVLEREKIHP